MKYRKFGSTGLKVSEVGMGCWAIGGNAFGNSYGPTDDAESIKTIRKALGVGCNFFDTADVYGHGHSEELLGLALNKDRERVIIATKVGGAYMYGGKIFGHINFSGEYVRFALQNSLKRLRTSYIDVYQFHNPPLNLIQEGEIFKALRKLQGEGKIRHVGVSVHTLEEGIAALDHADSIQCVFNILNPKNYELVETAKRRGIAVIVREPLANGLATGKYSKGSTFGEGDIRNNFPLDYLETVTSEINEMKRRFMQRKASMPQIAIKYVLSFDAVSVVIPGAKTEAQVTENIDASDMPDLTEEELRVFGS